MVTEGKRKSATCTDAPGIHYSCDSCFKDISHVLRIQCAECDEVDLCAECFSNGVEFQNHQKHHAYRILPPFTFSVYNNNNSNQAIEKDVKDEKDGYWRADEELLLIEGCESHGLGNWEDVAEHVGAKDQWQCEAHFYATYLAPLEPPIKKPKTPWAELASPLPSLPANHEIAGYMPLRCEFETEVDNEFEAQLKDFLFLDDDVPAETRLKHALLECYSSVLDARQARRQFIFAHNLLDFKKQQSVEKSRNKEDREVFQALRPFARFLNTHDFSLVHRGLVREEELKRRIYQLHEYRRHGLRTLSQVPAYENERKHFELYLKGGLISQSTPPLSKSPPPTTSMTSFNSSLGPLTSARVTPVSAQVETPPQAAPGSSSSRKASAPLNISHYDGIELLSEKERHICSILRLYPRLYIEIKDTLIREHLKHGGLKRAQARAAIKIDVNKTSKLYDFFTSAGWIKPPASGE